MLPPLREVIARHGLAARRALGQHFLLDANLTQRIVRAAGPLAGRHVVEVGPGPGGLTRALLGIRRGERDGRRDRSARCRGDAGPGGDGRRSAAHCRRRCAGGRCCVAGADAAAGGGQSAVQHRDAAADRLAASGVRVRAADADVPAGGCRTDLRRAGHRRRMGACPYWRNGPAARSCCCGFRRVHSCRRPKVFSAVVGLVPHAEQPEPALFAAMERLTAAAFGQRRKMLRGALKPLGGEALAASRRTSRRTGGRKRCRSLNSIGWPG